ncbi:MAG: enoyl-CoA hydratase/isomerase family protein [Deltaproteobacteria bacterium]|nr:enoyl-CoA hydratase/isomerase family protein [Deltaproteobacteria bacterium]MBW1950258.1 enoyl-CoA hydratase/isomerase family protein [Deltaproteobacteria bacterium]MBW2346720.1 enoyl-CoA hydratase/isomerase family protein [Deltaproteobacteria bacterium]RLB36402.1 MAG: crotonase [Deltaproteobacteria bacterium]
MAFENIFYEKQDDVARITVNRPDKRNALNRATRLEMAQALEDAESDPVIRVLILSGAGGKAFVSGSDLNELSRLDALGMEAFSSTLGQRFYTRFEQSPKPVIAMIDGLCLGGGLELALACDIRMASDRSRFGAPEMFIGVMPGSGGTQRLARLVGYGKAKEMILTGDMIDAGEAHRIGLVNSVHPPEALEGAVRETARRMARNSPLALKWAKRSINMTQEVGLSAGLAYEILAESLLFTGRDKEEGMKAFFEKRKPRFKGE